jgi:predicted DNA-binding transcriptional regulator
MPRPYRWSNLLIEVMDYLVPARRLSPTELAVYLFVLRQTRLHGRRQFQMRISKVARILRMQDMTLRLLLRSLEQKGCLSVVVNERTRFIVAARMPAEAVAWAIHHNPLITWPQRRFGRRRTKAIKRAMLALQDYRCFYCLKRLPFKRAVTDHVAAVTRGGKTTWENLVASCRECNQLKQTHSARVFLRSLYRDGYLSRAELEDRIRAVRRLRWTYSALARDPRSGFAKISPWRRRRQYRTM